MNLPDIRVQVPRASSQELQLTGINLTDNYANGQMQSSHGISTNRFPYITTADNLQIVDTGISEGYQPVSMFPWEQLFVVSDEPSEQGGYKCYYGGEYIGDVPTLTVPKQYAVVNSKLVVFPDKVYFSLYDFSKQSYPLTTAPLLAKVISGNVMYRRAVT